MEESEQLEQKTGSEIVSLLYGLLRALLLYEANNAAIARLLDLMTEQLTKYRAAGGTTLRMQIMAEECFVNGRLLKVDAGLFEKCNEVHASLQRFGFAEVLFGEECGRSHLEAFATNMAASLRSAAVPLEPEGVPEVRLAAVVGHSIASFRFDPSQLAVWLYTSLLDLVDALYLRHAEGSPMSLLQVKRVLQLVVDGMHENAGLYQLLTMVRDPKVPLSRTRARTVIAVETIGFSSWLGLKGGESLSLALAGLLGGLSDEVDADRAVEALFRYPGLGDSALGLVLAVHDERQARAGKSAGAGGKILAVVESWVEALAAADAPPPPKVIASLGSTDIGALFLQYKGKLPVGSPVRLSDGRVATVVGRATGAPPDRPVVLIAGEGSLDLAATPAIQIKEALRLTQAPDLTQVR